MEKERDILSQAHIEAGEIVEKGKADIKRMHESLRDDLTREATDIAIAMTKRITAGILTSEQQHKLIAKQIKDLL